MTKAIGQRRANRQATTPGGALPANRSFVVQFSGDAQPDGPWRGRAEHVVSGTRTRFASADELTAFMAQVLARLGREGEDA